MCRTWLVKLATHSQPTLSLRVNSYPHSWLTILLSLSLKINRGNQRSTTRQALTPPRYGDQVFTLLRTPTTVPLHEQIQPFSPTKDQRSKDSRLSSIISSLLSFFTKTFLTAILLDSLMQQNSTTFSALTPSSSSPHL